MEKKIKKDIVCSIPGGMYGNNAGFLSHDVKFGNVAVDSRVTVEAVSWLKRRASIISIIPSAYDNTLITLCYRLK